MFVSGTYADEVAFKISDIIEASVLSDFGSYSVKVFIDGNDEDQLKTFSINKNPLIFKDKDVFSYEVPLYIAILSCINGSDIDIGKGLIGLSCRHKVRVSSIDNGKYGSKELLGLLLNN